jgi:hypothetical protein
MSNILGLCGSDEEYSRGLSCSLNLISMFGFIEHAKTNDGRWLHFAMQNILTICIIMSFTGDNQITQFR